MNQIAPNWTNLPSDDALLPPDRIAELLGVSTHTLARWRRTEGSGPPFVRVSAVRVGYPVRAYRQWLAEKLES